MAAQEGPTKSTDHDAVVSVRVGSRGPYGVVLEDDGSGRAAVIRGWEKVEGKSGPVERHGGVRPGDVLVGVNETATAELSFGQVLELLRDESSLKKVLHFSSRAEVERRRGARGLARTGHEAPRFSSRVRRSRVQEPVGGAAPFAEYEIACALRVDATRVEHVAVRKWLLWRRYSEFEKLETQLRKSLGWQLEGAPFPPKHPFALDKLSADFLEQRRLDLDAWWQRVVSVDRACDFHMHHCDPALKKFLQADTFLAEDPTPPRDDEAPARRPRASKPIGRPASLKSGLSKRRLAASNSLKKDAPKLTAKPATDTPRDPAPPPPPRDDLPAPDPARAALLTQISSINLDD